MDKYLIILLLLSAFSCSERKGKKEHKTTTKAVETIGVRNAHMMTYDPIDSTIYCFGGADHEKVLSDLWRLDASEWVKVGTDKEPPARTFGSTAYESKEKRMVLFGGSKVLFGEELTIDNLLNDTWQFTNGQWEKIDCSNSPGPRAEAAMVYDEVNKEIVLFGGYTIENGNIIKLGDTWVFKENNWELRSTDGPTERHGVSLTYDSNNNQVVLFGGSTIDRQYGNGKGETWLWTNRQWQQLPTNEIHGLFNPTSAYHTHLRSIILFGGWNGQEREDKMFRFFDGKWKEILPNSRPKARNHGHMIYDERNNRLVLFGGHNGKEVFGDTWEFVDEDWKLLSEVQLISRVDNGH